MLEKNKPVESLTGVELEKLLLMHQVPWEEFGDKTKKLRLWRKILLSNKPPPDIVPWTPEDEQKLSCRQDVQIKLENTALGRKIALEKTKMKASINKMDLSEQQELEEKIRDIKRMKTEEHRDDGGKDEEDEFVHNESEEGNEGAV